MAGRARARHRGARRHPIRRPVCIGTEHGLAQRAGAGRADLRAAGDAREPRRADRPGGGRRPARSRCSRATPGARAPRSAPWRSPCCCSCPPASGRSSRSGPSCSRCRCSQPASLLLRSESRAPSHRIWLLVPLLALWGNLHGAVLTGAAVAGAYLIFQRGCCAAGREPCGDGAPRRSGAVREPRRSGRCRLTCLARAAQRGRAGQAIGLWAPLSPHRWLDVAFGLWRSPDAEGALRARPRVWSSSHCPGLALLTLHAARGGVWLALYAAPLAAAGFGGHGGSEAHSVLAGRVAGCSIAEGLTSMAAANMARRPRSCSARVVTRTLALAHGTPVPARICWPSRLPCGGASRRASPIDAFASRISASTSTAARRARGRRRAQRTPRARGARAAQQQGRAPTAHGRTLPPHRLSSTRPPLTRALRRTNLGAATRRWACRECPRAAHLLAPTRSCDSRG